MDTSTLELLELLEDSRFEAPMNAAVCPLYLSVGLWMGYHSPSYIDLLFISKVDKCTSRELGVVVYDDRVHDPILVYNLLDELDRHL